MDTLTKVLLCMITVSVIYIIYLKDRLSSRQLYIQELVIQKNDEIREATEQGEERYKRRYFDACFEVYREISTKYCDDNNAWGQLETPFSKCEPQIFDCSLESFNKKFEASALSPTVYVKKEFIFSILRSINRYNFNTKDRLSLITLLKDLISNLVQKDLLSYRNITDIEKLLLENNIEGICLYPTQEHSNPHIKTGMYY